jgi:lactate dehydrogenase-like 2-hydroxyacid dehydrogenase
MADPKPDVLLIGPAKPVFLRGLEPAFTVHRLNEATDREALIATIADRVRAFAVTYSNQKVTGDLMARFPKLELVATFGVGYDHIDANWAAAHGIIVTHTPDVLNEEVAMALGLLLCTVRGIHGPNVARAGKWERQHYPLTAATLRDRTVHCHGTDRPRVGAGSAPSRCRRHHSRRALAGPPLPALSSLIAMAQDADVLLAIVRAAPGPVSVDAKVLDALGPNGILINMARGSVVDEPALIKALKERKIMSAGLDVFVKEPVVPQELIDMEHVVLFPHLGSASVATRRAMDQLVVDNLLAWAAGKPPLTPVAETPWPPQR